MSIAQFAIVATPDIAGCRASGPRLVCKATLVRVGLGIICMVTQSVDKNFMGSKSVGALLRPLNCPRVHAALLCAACSLALAGLAAQRGMIG